MEPAGLGTAPGTAGTSPGNGGGTPGQTLQGSGYYLPNSTTPITDTSGNAYQWVSTIPQLTGAQSEGIPLYYQPEPGTFTQVTSQQGLGPGTPQFIKTANAA